MATDIGPIQLYVLSFEKPEFKGRIAEELEALRVSGVVRIVDSLAVVKDAQGDLMTARWSDLQETDGIPAGSVLGGLLGLELEAEGGPVDAGAIVRAIADEAPDEAEQATLRSMFEDVPRGGAVLMLLIEHRWALPLSGAVRGAGGVLSGQQMVPLATMERIPEVLARAADAPTGDRRGRGCAHHSDRLAGPIYAFRAQLGQSNQPDRPYPRQGAVADVRCDSEPIGFVRAGRERAERRRRHL